MTYAYSNQNFSKNKLCLEIPQIYVACLASYNNSILHGRWIDATQEVDAIQEEINQMLKESPISGTEEWAIHDINNFGSLNISEFEGLEAVTKKADFFIEFGELGAALFAHYGDNLEDAKDALEGCYQGEWCSEVEFAEHLFDECYAHDIPENLRHYYINYKAFAYDIFINDYFSLEVEGTIHVFTYL